MRWTLSMFAPVDSSGETKASRRPSGEMVRSPASWSSGMANSSFSATGGFWRVDWKMRKATIANANAAAEAISHQREGEEEVAASEAVESVPESAPSAKPRSRAD